MPKTPQKPNILAKPPLNNPIVDVETGLASYPYQAWFSDISSQIGSGGGGSSGYSGNQGQVGQSGYSGIGQNGQSGYSGFSGSSVIAQHDILSTTHSDTVVSVPDKNDIIKWNGTAWVATEVNTSFTFAITSFTSNVGSTVNLIGNGVWSAIGALSFSASYDNGPPLSSIVNSSTSWADLIMDGIDFVGPTLNVEAVNYPAVDSYVQFTLNATDGVDSSSSTLTYYFFNDIYYGVSIKDSSYIASDVTGLATSFLNNTQATTFPITAGAIEYVVYAYPKRMGVAYFWVNGFQGGFNSPETVSITNANGYTEDYYVYSSEHLNLGSITVLVTLTS